MERKGRLFWVKHISDIMMTNVNKKTDWVMQGVLPEGNYLRLNIIIEEKGHSDIDNVSAIRSLIATTNKQIINDRVFMEKLDQILEKLL